MMKKSKLGIETQGTIIKVSVVVPIYNVKNELSRCLDYLLNQTLKEIEIICINDASTDKSGEIINYYAAKDDRVVVINHESNMSASICRKEGVEIAKGEYLLFVDPDDYIEKDALDKLYSLAKEKKIEILHFGTRIINNGVTDNQVEWYKNFSKPYIGYIYGEDIFKKCFISQDYRFNIWNKLILTSLCKKAMLKHTNDPLPKAQDLYAFFLIAYYANSYYGIEDKFYNYSFGGGISGGRNFTEEKFRRHCTQSNVAYYIIDFLINEKKLDKYYMAAYRILNNLINDNIASIKACGKAKVNFGPERIFCEYWVEGNLVIKLLDYINTTNDFACAKLLFEIVFKILKNVSVKNRASCFNILLTIDKNYPEILKDLLTGYNIQSKDYMFLQIIIAHKKASQYKERYVPVFMATNDNYMPYLGVTLNSLICNSDGYYFYDIFILHSGLNNYYIDKLQSLQKDNISVCCINVKQIITSQSLYSNRHYSVEMYHRFLIPELFFFLRKAVYIDCDVILMDSIHKLYQIDIKDNVLGAARNLLHNEMYNYVIDKLHYKPEKYINSGVLIINCSEFISKGIKNKCYNYLRDHQELACPDQDALNLCCDKIFIIDNGWNYQWHHTFNTGLTKYELVANDKRIFEEASQGIHLVHFTSDKKPWNYSASTYSELFWEYAKSSVFAFEVEHRYRDYYDPINNKIKDLYTKIGKLNKQIEELTNKKKSKIVRFVKKIWQLIKKFFKSLKNKGIKYTFIRVFCGREKALSYENSKTNKVKQ